MIFPDSEAAVYLRIGFEITIECDASTPLLLALSPRPEEEHRLIGSSLIHAGPDTTLEYFLDEYGNQRARLVAAPGMTTLRSDCIAQDKGLFDKADWTARQHPVEELPVDTLPYLSASRYCESDALSEDAWRRFGDTVPGWLRVQEICDFVHNHIKFGYDYARSTKTACDAFQEGRGVCRDFAHLAIAYCRAMNIPARYASGYLSDIGIADPSAGDFCAWMEVFLGGRWHTFDPRNNAPRRGRVLMVRGRDAADVSMIASFGNCPVTNFAVWTHQVSGKNATSGGRAPDGAPARSPQAAGAS